VGISTLRTNAERIPSNQIKNFLIRHFSARTHVNGIAGPKNRISLIEYEKSLHCFSPIHHRYAGHVRYIPKTILINTGPYFFQFRIGIRFSLMQSIGKMLHIQLMVGESIIHVIESDPKGHKNSKGGQQPEQTASQNKS
jgi:hypothetical protein